MTSQNKKMGSITTKWFWSAPSGVQTKTFSISTKILTVIFVLCVCFPSVGAPRAEADCTSAIIIDGTTSVPDTCAPLTAITEATISESTHATAASTAAITTSAGATAGSTSGSAASNAALFTWDNVGKNALDWAAYKAAQMTLNQLTQNTIKWIKGGFHGSPSFAVDTNTIALDIADSVAGGMVLTLRNIASCDFSTDYTYNLINAVDTSVNKRPYIYSQKATCPFKTNLHFTAKEFYQDFNKGGWASFGAAMNDGGNPYGLQVITGEEQAAREAAAKAQKDKELSWSNGFTSLVDTTNCNYPSELTSIPNDPADPSTGQFDDTLPIITQAQAAANNAAVWDNPGTVQTLQQHYCQTTTPGKIVGDQLTKTLGLDMDRLGFADNMNKIISALLDTITQETIRGVFGPSNRSAGRTSAAGEQASGTHNVAVDTRPPTDLTKNSVTLNGYISYADASTKVGFLVGPTESSVLQSTTAVNSGTWAGAYSGDARLMPVLVIAPSNTGREFSKTITGLTPDTTYWFTVNAATSQPVPATNLHSPFGTSFHTLAE